MSTPPRETIQKQIQQDWANREYIEVITGSIKKITDFLNSFGQHRTTPDEISACNPEAQVLLTPNAVKTTIKCQLTKCTLPTIVQSTKLGLTLALWNVALAAAANACDAGNSRNGPPYLQNGVRFALTMNSPIS
ncbi:unnamed protein product [Leptidea sinapis]|uniref:Uncharacterized protein n=1 Tax=Leptidea sinapis TaxID=189913 RepID=A0A5E4R5D8_9NEOP|nr:unnamed protein product [Leptidea sinapis]